MEGTWWTEQGDLDEEQLKFIDCPKDGRYLLVGPPGSGKTNLLLLRAKYFYGAGLKNLLFLTYTNDLCDFIKTGIGAKGYLPEEIVMTYHSWATRFVRDHGKMSDLGKLSGHTEESRAHLLAIAQAAKEASITKKFYDMIFVDEAQDLTVEEIAFIASLSDRVAIAGDKRQGIYERNGLDNPTVLGLEKVELTYHYRIGPEICKVADKIITPENKDLLLEKFCNYKDVDFESSADMFPYASRDAQFEALIINLTTQLKAYPGGTIGIITGTNKTIEELRSRFEGTALSETIAYHDIDLADHSFNSTKRIHVLTAHSSKGTEFRAVHIYGIEEFKFPLNKRELLYTAVTRAKTSLLAYRNGHALGYIASAFAKPVATTVKDIF